MRLVGWDLLAAIATILVLIVVVGGHLLISYPLLRFRLERGGS